MFSKGFFFNVTKSQDCEVKGNHNGRQLTHSHAMTPFNIPGKQALIENTVGKGEIARNNVFYPFRLLAAIFNKLFEIVVCKLFQFGRV